MSSQQVPSLLDAALAYAARGWPVFPCNPKHKQPLLASQKDAAGKPIRGTGGVSAASTDAEQIRAWWRKWPKALIGLATGHPTQDAARKRLFVLDFDPREDKDTGEVWTLERLKTETEDQLGCQLPLTLTALSPSDGVHLYLLQGDDGPPITNRGNLPHHVDVRGLGGYVIAPPSVMGPNAIKGQADLRYRWHRKEPIGGIALAPDRLLEVLREKKAPPSSSSSSSAAPASPPPASAAASFQPSGSADDDVRKYALSALDAECREVRIALSGQRNAQLNVSALKIAALVAAGALDGTIARSSLEAAARDNAGNDDDRQLLATIDSGWEKGLSEPRNLSDIAAAAKERAERRARAGPARSSPRPAGGGSSAPFRIGTQRNDALAEAKAPRELEERDLERLRNIAERWLIQRLIDLAEREPAAEAAKKVAWGIGCRGAAELLEPLEAKERLWQVIEDAGIADVQHADVDQAIAQGTARGFNAGPQLQDLELARYPLTDFGIAERFRERYGANYRFTTAKGWLGWDGRRWKVLDQDEKTPPGEVIAAVFDTVRLIQREARRIRETGTQWRLIRKGKEVELEELDDPNPHGLDKWIPKGKSFELYSDLIAKFGRASETSGKPASIAQLARQWLTVPIEQFDCEQMAINVLNGTLRIAGELMPDGSTVARITLDPHRREDLVTRLAPVNYEPDAPAPLYDAMLAWAQPEPPMRRYIHQMAGYAITGDTSEHKLWFHYGGGRNGKSTAIDAWCSGLGDYSDTIGIDSFLDQGIKKRGDSATPDLAKLGGVRMLRASEPEKGAKLNSALIKAATGGEPMSVRALHRGFFNLLPRFKLLISGNIRPSIPDTDDGIWSRMKLVPWLRNIERQDLDPFKSKYPESNAAWPAKDPKLLDKIKAQELGGVFARLVRGLADWVEHGFLEPETVTAATKAYREHSDPLQRFLSLCTVLEPDSRVKSSELFEVYEAWAKAAGETAGKAGQAWSAKGFANAMIDKGFEKTRSDGMRWLGLRLCRAVSDFLDGEGKVRSDMPDLEDPLLQQSSARAAASLADDDDDLPI